jgi:hypothetical protein
MNLKDCVEKAVKEGHNLSDYTGAWLAKDEHDVEKSLYPVIQSFEQLFATSSTYELCEWLSKNTHMTFIQRHTYKDTTSSWTEEEGTAIVWYKTNVLAHIDIEQEFDGKDYFCNTNIPVVLQLMSDYTQTINSSFFESKIDNEWSETSTYDNSLFLELMR